MIDTKKLKNIFKDYPYIVSVYLFGSHAFGKIGPMSDVDIAILLKDRCSQRKEIDSRRRLSGVQDC